MELREIDVKEAQAIKNLLLILPVVALKSMEQHVVATLIKVSMKIPEWLWLS